MPILFWILVFILTLSFGYLFVCIFTTLTLAKVGEHPQYDQNPSIFGLDFDKVNFQSRNGHLNLAAWYIPNERAKGAVILVHGRNASKQNAISGKFPALAAEIHKLGLSILMLDLRGHGESDGKYYTWGWFEKQDVLGAFDYLLGRSYQPGKIALLGISLGGAAVIGAAAEETAVGALVIESTFADLMDLVEPNWTKESGLPMFFLPGVYLVWKIFFGFDLNKVKPVNEIKAVASRPVLILHSKDDEVIPVSHAHKLAEAEPHAQLVLFDNCDHAEIFRDEPEKYLQALIPFLQNQL